MTRAVYCATCGRPTQAVADKEGYHVRVHRRADKPKEPLVLCSGWRRHDHIPILLGREQALADAMDDEEDNRAGSPDDRTILATEVNACIGRADDHEFILIRFAGTQGSDDGETADASGVIPVQFLEGLIAQLQHLLFHLHKPETN